MSVPVGTYTVTPCEVSTVASAPSTRTCAVPSTRKVWSTAMTRTRELPAAMRTRSMAPRTDEPTRTSGWSRLRRTTRTTRSTQSSGAAGARRATMTASSCAGW